MPTPSQVPAFDALVDALAGVIRRHRNLSIDVSHSTGFSPSQVAVVAVLGRLGEARMTELADELFVDPSVVSRHVAPLEEAGCVERRTDPADGRVSLLRLTETGEDIRTAVRASRRDHLERALQGWSIPEVNTLTEALDTIATALDEELPATGSPTAPAGDEA